MFTRDYFWIALGASFGACLRYAIAHLCFICFGPIFPIGTLLVNILGCFILGNLYAFIQGNNLFSSILHPLLGIGFCGGLTTFSAFAMENMLLIGQGAWLKAGLFTFLNLAFCLSATALGYYACVCWQK